MGIVENRLAHPPDAAKLGTTATTHCSPWHLALGWWL